MWKFKSWKGKDKWLFLLTVGVILCILAIPAGGSAGAFGGGSVQKDAKKTGAGDFRGAVTGAGVGSEGEGAVGAGVGAEGGGAAGGGGAAADSGAAGAGSASPAASAVSSAKPASAYEQQMEQRVKDILKNVDGVGEVEVMIVLKSSAEKIIHMDGSNTRSVTDETDSSGGARKIENEDRENSTVLTSADGNSSPIIEKELYPEISGIMISAAGGGSPRVQEEISSAMQALFGLPAHKIKVLKRVE